MERLKTGDNVLVIAGRDKGQKGKVLRVLHEKNRVLVEGVNKVQKHQSSMGGRQAGGIIEREASIHVSNVMLMDSKTNERTRVRYELNKDGVKTRVATKSGNVIEA